LNYDLVGILNLPDNVSAAAFSLAVSAGAAVKAIKTTPLMTLEEGIQAWRRPLRAATGRPESRRVRLEQNRARTFQTFRRSASGNHGRARFAGLVLAGLGAASLAAAQTSPGQPGAPPAPAQVSAPPAVNTARLPQAV
jgi:hypothetical protein